MSIAVVGALFVAVVVPVFLAAGSPSAPARSPERLQGGSLAGPAGSFVAPAGSGSASDPAGAIVASRIRVPRLGIDLPIVEGDGIDAPIDKAAHYPGSGWPGGGTNIYLYGHAREGMFLPLWDAKVGDTVTLDLAGGGERSYRVVEVLPRVPWNAHQYLEPTPREILTLQTSTASYPTAPRFIVVAEPVT